MSLIDWIFSRLLPAAPAAPAAEHPCVMCGEEAHARRAGYLFCDCCLPRAARYLEHTIQ